ncbi:mitochondrial import inner membrane translocase subunit Tim21-like isoform X2 [Watersipora subatra]|uniref:mitochondrial import inner membrane translocase subunit Tim21-like isoform X2 n=1 Tax=Watersipora subatra TaxID=2589382 RepID=UPI00355BCA7B
MTLSTLRLVSKTLPQYRLCFCKNHQYLLLILPNRPAPRAITTCAKFLQVRKQEESSADKEIDIQRERPYEHLTAGQKVAQAGADLTSLLVIIAGLGITGVLFYAVGSELFSSSGPNAVYSAAFKRCTNDIQVLDALGQPVKGHGETNRRGRRQHVQHTEFMNNNGEQHTRIKFYLKGAFRSAVVHAEMFKL